MLVHLQGLCTITSLIPAKLFVKQVATVYCLLTILVKEVFKSIH